MRDESLFVELARQAGYRPEAAQAALAWAVGTLAVDGQLYIFRSAGPGASAGGAGAAPTRPRLLLAFRSADAALVFAQRAGLGRAPQVAGLSLSRLLGVLVQRPAIAALLVAVDSDEPLRGGLPPGPQIARAALLDRLQMADGAA
jgi:hypothetical protein